MQRLSLAQRIALFWGLLVQLCAALLVIVWLLLSANQKRLTNGSEQRSDLACQSLVRRLDASAGRNTGSAVNADLLHAVLDIGLADASGIEGGAWSSAAKTGADTAAANAQDASAGRFLAYSFPTYEGSGVKRDIPQTEMPMIERVATQALSQRATLHETLAGSAGALVVSACVSQVVPGLAFWTLTRTHAVLPAGGYTLATVLAALLAAVLCGSTAFGLALRRWSVRLGELERRLAEQALEPIVGPGHDPRSDMFAAPRLPDTGEPDLDRIVKAFNRFGARLAQERAHAESLAAKLAQADRFVALGRLAAQMAHEIRNPVAAMRLKAENALLGDDLRRQAALQTIVAQVDRIDTQLGSLLALTQPIRIVPEAVAVAPWLHAHVALFSEAAQKKNIALRLCAGNQVTDLSATMHAGAAAAGVDQVTPHVDLQQLAESPEKTRAGAANDSAGPVPDWHFDPVQLGRALDNLVLNALQHTPPGGCILISAAIDAPTDASSAAAAADAKAATAQRLQISVRNTGSVIAAAERERIFEPFVTHRAQGAGLGLALVREIVTAHGGSVELIDGTASGSKADAASGAHFRMTLP